MLDALLDEPQTSAELERSLTASRSTIHRTTESLIEEGLLEKSEQEYALTDTGQMLATEVVQFQKRSTMVRELEPFIETADIDDVRLPLDHLADATVIRPDPKRSHQVAQHILDRIDTMSSLRLFSGVVSPIYLDAIYDAVIEGATVEAIYDPQIIEILFTEYGRESKEAVRKGELAIKIYDDCPFELFIFDESVFLVAHDENGFPRAVVESDAPAVRDWAEALFERYAEASEYATIF